MANIIVIFACLAAGLVYQYAERRGRGTGLVSSRVAAGVLGRVVISFSLPALTLLSVHELHEFKASSLAAVAMPWLVFAATLLAALTRVGRWSRPLMACVVLCAGFGNTSFVGYPLIEALLGREAMPMAVLIDQAGCFPAIALGGLAVLAVAGGKKPSAREIARRVFAFPPFLALVLAVVLKPIDFPAPLRDALTRIALTLVPLALLSVGLQIRLDARLVGRHAKPLVLGLTLKLVAAPALVFALWRGFGATGLDFRVTVAQAAMAPMITGAILASEAGFEPELAGLFIGIGIPLSFLTVPAWVYLSRG